MPRPRDVLPAAKPAKKFPFPFILDELEALSPVTRPMFGCQAVYVGPKIMLILRDKGGADVDSGLWIASEIEHHASLRAQLPSLRTIEVFGPGESAWRCLPSDGDRFEEEALRVCAMIRANDPRIGRVPGAKKKKAAPKVKTAAKKAAPKVKTAAKKAAPKKSRTAR